MRRRLLYTDVEWTLYEDGAEQAKARVALKVPARLTPLQQTAFREGYYAHREELANVPVVKEVRIMLGGHSAENVIRQFVHT